MSAELMRRAIALALENIRAARCGPFAALVAKQGNVIGEGANSVTATNDPTAHAEVVAIRAACRALGSFQLNDCELFTTCEPCPMCMGAIYWARLSKIYYASTRNDAAHVGFDDSLIYDQLALAPGERKIPMTQLMREQ